MGKHKVWGTKLLFMLFPAVVAFSDTRALSLLHLLVATIAFGLLGLFSVQGLAWLSFSPQSPGFWPDVWPSGLSGGDWAKWFFLLTYATYSCETAATFVGDSRHPQKTLNVLNGTMVFMPIVFIGASWVVSRVVTESGLPDVPDVPDDLFLLLVKTATPFWGKWASIGIMGLIATGGFGAVDCGGKCGVVYRIYAVALGILATVSAAAIRTGLAVFSGIWSRSDRALANFRKEAKQLAAQLIQQGKMSSLGQVVAGVAHEINNPISFIHGNLQYVNQYSTTLLDLLQTYAQEYPHPPIALANRLATADLAFIQQDLPKIIGSMNMGSDRIRDIILSLRTFSRLDESDWKSANLHADIDSTRLLLQHRLNSSKPPIVVQSHYGDLPLVQCSPPRSTKV